MKTLWIALIGLVIGQVALAQDCQNTLSGQVIDFHTGEPLVNAVVYFRESGKFSYTDDAGEFEIKNLCTGKKQVEVTHPQCEKIQKNISIVEGDNSENFRLEHHLEELNTVKISGKKGNQNTTATAQEASLTQETLESYSSKNLGDALEEVSGVSTLKTGNSIVKPIIQGFHSSRVMMVNHGVQMQDQEWGMEHAPNIDINSIGKLSVVKGAAALEYGGSAVGGAVIADAPNIPLKDSLFGKTIGSGSSNGRGGSLSTSLTKSYQNGWYGRVQGTLKKFGDRRAPDYALSNTGNTEQDFSLQVGLDKFGYGFDAYYSLYNSEIGILRPSHIGNAGDLVTAINSQEPNFISDFSYDLNPPRQDLQHHLAKIEGYKRFSGFGKLTAQYSFQQNERLEFDIRRGDDKDKPAVDLELTTHQFKTVFNVDERNYYSLKFVLQAGFQNNFADPDTGVRRLIPDYDQTDFGGFVSGDYQFNDNWQAEAGFRLDYRHLDSKKFYLINRWERLGYDQGFSDLIIDEVNSQYLTNPVFDFTTPSATAGVNYSWNKKYSLKLNYSLAGRPPNPAELFSDGLHHSSATIEFGDLRIDPEYSHKVTLGFQRKAKDWQFDITPYVNSVKDFINIEPTGLLTTIRGAFPVWEFKQIDAFLAGIDIDARYKFDEDFQFNTQFSYVYGQNTTKAKPLINMPPANWKNTLGYKNAHWNNFNLSLSGNWTFRQTRYPDNNFTFESIQNGQNTVQLVDISTPPDAYFLMDFNAGIEFRSFSTGSLQVNLNVNNILNTNYRNYLNRQRYYADELGRNFNLQFIFNY